MSVTTTTAWWRTPPSGTEGVGTIYVDGNFGSDTFGDGTRKYPVKTLKCAWDRTAKPGLIVCRGPVYGSLVGNHSCSIVADYYGAAIYEGIVGENQFCGLPWFASYNRMIIKHAKGAPEPDITSQMVSWASFGGCGRSDNAYGVGYADRVGGLASSPLTIVDSTLWRGAIAGGNYIVYSHIQRCDGCGVTFGGYNCNSASSSVYNITVYDLPFATRDITKSANTSAFFGRYCLFSKVDFIMEHSDTFNECFFDKDCNFYLVDSKSGSETNGKRVLLKWAYVADQETQYASNLTDENSATGYSLTVSGDAIKGVSEMFDALLENGNMTATIRNRFNKCKFSSQGASEIFNDVINDDYTLAEGSDATIGDNYYYGAMPLSLKIKIYNDLNGSDQKLNCFDNRTMSGCLAIENGTLCVDENSEDTKGFIATKILKINPREKQINGIYTLLKNDLEKLNFTVANSENASSLTYGNRIELTNSSPEATLEEGCYLVSSGNIEYKGDTYVKGECVYVKEQDITDAVNTIKKTDDDAIVVPILNTNIVNSIGVRCRSMLYNNGNPYCRVYHNGSTQTNKTLMPNVTYLNCGRKNIIYNARTIIPGESFVVSDNITTFNGEDLDDNYFVCAMFDDRSFADGESIPSNYPIVPIEPWCFGQLWGDYFVVKNSGNITSINNEKKSSGNYQAYKSGGSQGINLATGEATTIINQPYVQFGLFVTKP